MNRVLAAYLLFCLGSGLLPAQDFERVAPKPVPPVPAPNAGNEPRTEKQNSGPSAQETLIARVRGLIFVARGDAVKKGGRDLTGVRLINLTVPEETKFRQLIDPYVGRKLTRGDLNTLIQTIIIYYRSENRPVVDVEVPEQDITTGVLQVVILEGRAGKVIAQGQRWFSASELAGAIREKPGDTLNASRLQDDLDWLNSNPFHTSDMVYRAGEQVGTTDLLLKTQDRFPARFYVGYEDTGNAATGFDRYLAGVNWGDAFGLGLGQQLNYQYTTSGDGEALRAHSGSYVIPLPWRHTLTFFGSYVDTKGEIPPDLGINGRSYQVSGRYTAPLPTFRSPNLTIREAFSAGFDYKYNNNSLEFDAQEIGQTLYDVDQFVFNYTASETDVQGFTTLSETLNFSPGGFGGHNVNAAYELTHAGATSDYAYDTIALERTTRLPADFSLVLRATVQKSDGNLVPSEQLGFGGYGSVRGYDDREVNTDEGYIYTAEVRSPRFSFGELANAKSFWNDEMQLLAFWDYGSANNHSPLQGENRNIELSSVGAGFRYQVGAYASIRFDYGFQLLSTGFDQQHGSRGDVGLTLSY